MPFKLLGEAQDGRSFSGPEDIAYRDSYFYALSVVWKDDTPAMKWAMLLPARLLPQIRFLRVRYYFMTRLRNDLMFQHVKVDCERSVEGFKVYYISLEGIESATGFIDRGNEEYPGSKKDEVTVLMETFIKDLSGPAKISFVLPHISYEL
ncbi:uncharacterized protein BDZ99DRAFT_113512 [Mytilinidion resinicola]|uniref:Uncharacterized protein n=1 Tax=Mytilinidion resinicola TaxID=574789 RepID=A0A6A6YAH6_9PEZI|nr:uncharacterized protein BDZ99DRAFT_113512 [Mytilinidion resinicola]KAF2805125.1 hypothetical protein BDZ99DRAFT_113512 [Mytilinidion resinicola]